MNGKKKVNGGAQRLKMNTQWLEKHESVLLTFHIFLSHQISPNSESTGGRGGREKNVTGEGLATLQLASILHRIKRIQSYCVKDTGTLLKHIQSLCHSPSPTITTLKRSIIEIA